MKMPLVSRIIFYFMGVMLPVGAHVADFSKTHIFNSEWPPHAKFHTGQTLMFSIFLGLFTIFLASRKTSDKALELIAVTICAGIYWITQALAIVYPGTAFFDPQFDTPSSYLFGVPAQLIVDMVAVTLIFIALTFALRKSASWVETKS